METLYSKLYDKYDKLKKQKESAIEKCSHEQELKFVNYVNAVEELVEHLRNENTRLKAQINELTDEVVSVRSAKERQCAEYQKLLNEETQKNKELSEEVQILQNLQREGLFSSSKDRNNDNVQLHSPGTTQAGLKDASKGSSGKRPRTQHDASLRDETSANESHFSMVTESERFSCRGALFDDSGNTQLQANHCSGNTTTSGEFVNATGLFQLLVEYLVGMKFSPVNEPEGRGLSALHQSSGYSFSLTWTSKASKEQENELFYRVSSLGTFERVAPEWMKEDLMFSTSMCPMFFKRISRVIGLQY